MHIEVLKEALVASVGADLDVQCTVAGAATAPATPAPSSSGSATPLPPPTPYEGFAPGDEAVADDPDEPKPAGPVLHGDDAALALVQSELGGKVVETSGE